MAKEIRVKEAKYISDITGKDLTGKWHVTGTDLGIPVYSALKQRVYFLFGDTLDENPEDPFDEAYEWRGTVAGYTENFDLSDGLHWDGFLLDERGFAKGLVADHHDDTEVTKISQGGIEVDGALYVFYESIHHWGPKASNLWYLNFCGVLKSTDGGENFERVHDLTWIEPTDPELGAVAKRIAEEDMNNNPTEYDLDLAAHIAPGFGQMYAADGKDGYIYIYGRYGGRIHGIKVGRVKRENIEIFAEYEYLTGYCDGEPVWKKHREGLDAIMADEKAAEVIPGPTSNMSVFYNNYLERWMLTYYKPVEGIFYACSKTPYGPFETPQMMLPVEHPDLNRDMPENPNSNRLYGGFSHEVLCREQGKIVPLIISTWNDFPDKPRTYCSRLFEIVFE